MIENVLIEKVLGFVVGVGVGSFVLVVAVAQNAVERIKELGHGGCWSHVVQTNVGVAVDIAVSQVQELMLWLEVLSQQRQRGSPAKDVWFEKQSRNPQGGQFGGKPKLGIGHQRVGCLGFVPHGSGIPPTTPREIAHMPRRFTVLVERHHQNRCQFDRSPLVQDILDVRTVGISPRYRPNQRSRLSKGRRVNLGHVMPPGQSTVPCWSHNPFFRHCCHCYCCSYGRFGCRWIDQFRDWYPVDTKQKKEK